jgi:hypothetical protein
MGNYGQMLPILTTFNNVKTIPRAATRKVIRRATACEPVPVLLLVLVHLCGPIELCQADTVLGEKAGRTHHAPPTPPPVAERTVPLDGMEAELSAASSTLYSIGEPTDEEQLYLELLNRARLHPQAEARILRDTSDAAVQSAYRYFRVDLNLLISQFSSIPTVPPLSMNAKLMAAARLHSRDMLTNAFQGHNGSDGRNPGARINAQGYNWVTYGENVYAWAESVWYGHAGFEVDWGTGVGGMQVPPGHRLNIHQANFREVGIGVVVGQNASVGPQLVTQDFADSIDAKPFITGVAYHDFNDNSFYDPGEGIAGVRVYVTGSSAHAITAGSGGYSVPVPGDGSYQVLFTSANGATLDQLAVAVSARRNVKVDFVPKYSPSMITGPTNPVVARSTLYRFTTSELAAGYQWKHRRRIPFTAVEGGEGSLNNITAATSPGYSVTVADAATGSKAFHLAHSQPEDQVITLNRALLVRASSQLIFASRLGWAAASQVARAQVSTNGGASWRDVWSRAGTGNSGQSTFVTYANSLGTFAGSEINIRFIYDLASGSYYSQTGSGAGWYLDDIRVTDAEEAIEEVVNDASNGTFSFVPDAPGDYVLSVRAKTGSRTLSWGPPLLVSSLPDGPTVRILGAPVVAGNRVELNFEVFGDTGAGFQVEHASEPEGPWTKDPSASFQAIVGGKRYRVNADRGDSVLYFFRIITR